MHNPLKHRVDPTKLTQPGQEFVYKRFNIITVHISDLIFFCSGVFNESKLEILKRDKTAQQKSWQCRLFATTRIFQGINTGLKALRKFLKLISSSLELNQNYSIYWSLFLISMFVERLLPESRLIFTNKGRRREKRRSHSSSIRKCREI